MKMKLLNIDEEAPNEFYVFVGLGKSMSSRANYHNYKLSKKIMSSGIINLTFKTEKKQDFINGDITYAPFVPNKTTFDSPTSHLLGVINGYQVEYILEYYRPKKCPSRFSCVYAFGDYESCVKASQLYKDMFDLSKVKKFRLKTDNQELKECTKIAKCNMQIVTLMWKSEITTFGAEGIESMAKAYWNGKGEVFTERQSIDDGAYYRDRSDVLYEYLIEGVLEEIEE